MQMSYSAYLTSSLGKNLRVPVYELLGGKVRNEVQVYCWIGGDRPSDIENAAYVEPTHRFARSENSYR